MHMCWHAEEWACRPMSSSAPRRNCDSWTAVCLFACHCANLQGNNCQNMDQHPTNHMQILVHMCQCKASMHAHSLSPGECPLSPLQVSSMTCCTLPLRHAGRSVTHGMPCWCWACSSLHIICSVSDQHPSSLGCFIPVICCTRHFPTRHSREEQGL